MHSDAVCVLQAEDKQSTEADPKATNTKELAEKENNYSKRAPNVQGIFFFNEHE